MKRSEIQSGSELYGAALEHQVFLELRAFLDYHRIDRDLTFWRSHSGPEVDFVVGGDVAIEKPELKLALQSARQETWFKASKTVFICFEGGAITWSRRGHGSPRILIREVNLFFEINRPRAKLPNQGFGDRFGVAVF